VSKIEINEKKRIRTSRTKLYYTKTTVGILMSIFYILQIFSSEILIIFDSNITFSCHVNMYTTSDLM